MLGESTNQGAHFAASSEPRSPPGARRGASNEPTSPQGARSGVRTSFSNAPRTILARFWSILARFLTLRGSILEVVRRFFDAFALELANSLEEEATSGKPVKTMRKLLVFTCFQHVRVCAHDANTDRKSFRTRFSTESRVGSPLKVAFFELPSLNMVSEGSPGRPWTAPGTTLGLSWALLGRSWAALGALLGALGPLLGRLWGSRERIYREAFSQ